MWSINVDLKHMNAGVEFVWWGGVRSHFRVQPNYSVEVVLWLYCVVVGVGVVTIFFLAMSPRDAVLSKISQLKSRCD